MSPTPLIDLQRRLSIVGAIRAGGEKQPKAPGKKLEAYRLTSPRRQLIEQAAALYGGAISPWKSPTGDEWQVYTEAEEIPVLVMPGYSLRQTYELWEGATKRLRLCDGVDEELTGGPCICNASGQDACDLYTRLVVALPELDTVLGWRLITKGANAAHELPTMMALMEAKGGSFVPARLRLDQRRGVKDGQVLRFVVPTIDLGVGYLALAQPVPDGSRAALPPAGGFTPAVRQQPTVEQALGAASPRPGTAGNGTGSPGPESAAPALAVEEAHQQQGEEQSKAGEGEASQTFKATEAQKKKMNVLVAHLAQAGQLDKAKLYDAIAGLRGLGGLELIDQLGGYDADHIVHWSPLRDALTRPEASQLIEWLEAKERKTQGEVTKAEPVPYNEFPPTY